MHLSQINEITDHRITSGSEYQWQCYPDARYLDYESDYAHLSVLYKQYIVPKCPLKLRHGKKIKNLIVG